MANQFNVRDSLYLVDNLEETTFKYDNQLPALPVPTIEQSVLKLLDTIRPIATDEKVFQETERKALNFIQDLNVKELQDLLNERSSKHKNWLEEWWLEFAYLRSRKPLIPYSNMAAPLPILKFWPIVETNNNGVRSKRAALSTYFQLCFWKMLREERMRPMIHHGVPWSMNQFRYLFNTVRRPGEPKDELVSWFKLAREGPPESLEIIVLYRGYIFAMQPVTMRGQANVCILSAPLIEKQLNFIESYCLSKGTPGSGVACLTTLERTDWTEAREKLSKISYKNRQLLKRIDKALSVLVLDDNEPTIMNDIFRQSMCGDPYNRWADKSISSIVFKNGTFGANADHTPYDGFCTSIMTHYLMTSVDECQGEWNDQMSSASNSMWAEYIQPEELAFDLDIEMSNCIEEAKVHFDKIAITIETIHETFGHFGKAILKQHRFHPEAFVQTAIHATYYKLHNNMAPAYVTASTRRYYNGRTETCRSCYPEMKEFADYLKEHGTTKPKLGYELIKKSVQKFQTLMNEASSGNGCDRHLLGLYLVAMLEGKPIPELFEDELVLRTNNYVLSTSCSGYSWNVCGGVPPLVFEGYGVFYAIEDEAITFACTAYKTCPDTDLRKFYQTLQQCLIDMQKILLSSSSKL